MIGATSSSQTFQQRGARAALLASSADSVREPLRFAAALCEAQAAITFPEKLSGRLADDWHSLSLRPVLKAAAEYGPEALAIEAEKRLHDDADTTRTRLLVYWDGERDYLSRAMLQPYAEALRARSVTPDRTHAPGHCPFCGAAPWISARKASGDGDSGFRYLGCSLCGLEWNFNRGKCPSCEEEDPYKLPSFQSDTYKNVRLEACETCRRYVKSIDMTADARPIPIIDDLLSISMDLWAADEGFTRIEPGLAGL